MVWWKPDRMAAWTNPQDAQLNRKPEEGVEERVAVRAHEGGPIPEERGQSTRWSEPVPQDTFVAALRALADALSQDQDFTFAVDHRFIIMRPLGTPGIEYYERADQRKELTFRFEWEA